MCIAGAPGRLAILYNQIFADQPLEQRQAWIREDSPRLVAAMTVRRTKFTEPVVTRELLAHRLLNLAE